MSSKRRKVVLSVFLAMVVVLGCIGFMANRINVQEGQKDVTLEVVSERDALQETVFVEDAEFDTLGELLRTLDYCEWTESSYGLYITGFYDCMEDIDNQYWWCVIVNGEQATTGVDEIPLQDDDVYTFTLKQGW